jgi:Tol biopolymer transport system component
LCGGVVSGVEGGGGYLPWQERQDSLFGYDGNDYVIYTINSRGEGKFNVSNNDPDSSDDVAPDYSPDGRKIVFMTYDDQGGTWLSTINVDGSNETEITDRDTADYVADAFESPSRGSQ